MTRSRNKEIMNDCECKNWARADFSSPLKSATGIPLVTNHHPNCPHYNDSLMDVWKVTCNGSRYYASTEPEAEEIAVSESNGDTAAIEKVKMHREIFENLPEFDGF